MTQKWRNWLYVDWTSTFPDRFRRRDSRIFISSNFLCECAWEAMKVVEGATCTTRGDERQLTLSWAPKNVIKILLKISAPATSERTNEVGSYREPHRETGNVTIRAKRSRMWNVRGIVNRKSLCRKNKELLERDYGNETRRIWWHQQAARLLKLSSPTTFMFGCNLCRNWQCFGLEGMKKKFLSFLLFTKLET